MISHGFLVFLCNGIGAKVIHILYYDIKTTFCQGNML